MSEKKRDNKQFARNLAITLGGGALGAGVGYGTTSLMERAYGERLRRLDPKKRLKTLIPLLAAAGTAGAFAQTMRQDAVKRQEQRLQKKASAPFYLALEACKERDND